MNTRRRKPRLQGSSGRLRRFGALVIELGGFTVRVAGRFFADGCPQVAASLAFGTLLSLIPFIAVALVVVSVVPAFDRFTVEVRLFLLAHMMPETASHIIGTYMAQFSEKAAQLTSLGIAFLAVTAVSLMYTINTAFNKIWRVARPRPLLRRLAVYAGVLTVGPVLMGLSLSLTTYLITTTADWVEVIPGAGLMLLAVMPVAFTAGCFLLLYRVVPNRRVKTPPALVGALMAALLFDVMKRGFAAYVLLFPTYHLIYGAFAALPVFLLWIYLSWIVILLGAEIAATLEA